MQLRLEARELGNEWSDEYSIEITVEPEEWRRRVRAFEELRERYPGLTGLRFEEEGVVRSGDDELPVVLIEAEYANGVAIYYAHVDDGPIIESRDLVGWSSEENQPALWS